MTIAQSAGGVVMNDKNEVVIVQQKSLTWSLPKGHIEPGENILETAIREIEEECGITELEYIKAFPSYERATTGHNTQRKDEQSKIIYLFLFKTNQSLLKPIDPDNPQAKWVAKTEVSMYLSHPKDKEFFEKSILPELN